jgi:hypothetical protein
MWMIIKMIFFYTGVFAFSVVPSGMINILCLLLSISIGLFILKRKSTEATSLLTDIKNGMTAGVPYIVLVSLFMYIFYSKINPGFIAELRAEKISQETENINDPIKLDIYKRNNEDAEVMTKNQILDKMTQNIKATINAKTTSLLNLLALLMLSTINSIFISVIYRKIVFR